MAEKPKRPSKIPPKTYKNRHFMGRLFKLCICVFAPFSSARPSSERGRTRNLYHVHPLSSDCAALILKGTNEILDFIGRGPKGQPLILSLALTLQGRAFAATASGANICSSFHHRSQRRPRRIELRARA